MKRFVSNPRLVSYRQLLLPGFVPAVVALPGMAATPVLSTDAPDADLLFLFADPVSADAGDALRPLLFGPTAESFLFMLFAGVPETVGPMSPDVAGAAFR